MFDNIMDVIDISEKEFDVFEHYGGKFIHCLKLSWLHGFMQKLFQWNHICMDSDWQYTLLIEEKTSPQK